MDSGRCVGDGGGLGHQLTVARGRGGGGGGSPDLQEAVRERPAVVLEAEEDEVVDAHDRVGVGALQQLLHGPGPVPGPAPPPADRVQRRRNGGEVQPEHRDCSLARQPLQRGGVPLEVGGVQRGGPMLQRLLRDVRGGGAWAEEGDAPRGPAKEKREDGEELDGLHDELVGQDDDDALDDAEVPRGAGGGAEPHLKGGEGAGGEAEADVGGGGGGLGGRAGMHQKRKDPRGSTSTPAPGVHWGGVTPPGRPAYAHPSVTASARFNGMCNRQ